MNKVIVWIAAVVLGVIAMGSAAVSGEEGSKGNKREERFAFGAAGVTMILALLLAAQS